MEDFPHPDTGKRKRSPADSLVDVSIPSLSHYDSETSLHGSSTTPAEGDHPSKRLRLPMKPPAPLSGLLSLPSGITQTIFSYLDPPSLGRLICVNRRFRALLDSRLLLPSDQILHHGSKDDSFQVDLYPARSQDTVWTTSRRRYAPSMPKPMNGLSERDLFALAFGTTCQFCGTRPHRATRRSQYTWQPVRGEPSVRTFWPLRIRSCMQCLAPRLRKDSDVMMSDASSLRPGLSFAFFTQDLHFVPKYLWQTSVPHNTDLQKYYYIPDIQLLQEEASSVQALGPGAAEEWVKGLPSRGRSTQDFALRCEEWEVNGGLDNAHRSLFSHRDILPGADMLLGQSPVSSNLLKVSALPMSLPHVLPAMPLQSYGPAPGMDAPPGLPPKPSDASSMGSQTSHHRYKAAPSSRDLARARAHKKAQIVERCRALDPPIDRDMLERLDAFRNALQVPMPLNESSWETLKSLLLRQRTQIELQDEARNSATTAPIPGQFTAPSRSDEYVLAHADLPVKEKLCQIAKEFIKQRFGHGAWVTYPTSPQFAAEVLIHTRETFMADRARIKTLRSQAGYVALSTPQDEMLRYEHMKWVFDQTIKPQTEQIRKDLFLCAACPTGGAVKFFPFESMIQHYSYKHDTSFTTDAPRAFWKFEWPKIPPFNMHPESVHTPEPSITHTPTLSHQPLPLMSPGSISMTAPLGRRTPDTMSLLSGNTNPLSGWPARVHNAQAGGPDPEMYERQRDSLAAEIVRGWTLTTSLARMPLGLQLFLILDFAIMAFSKKFHNEPSLNLLSDCIGVESDLRQLRDVEALKCAECAHYGDEIALVKWSLQDLIAHFRKMHVENNQSGPRLEWKRHMISLPEPVFIRSLLANDNMPTMLRDLLKEAEIQAVIQKGTTDSLRVKYVRQQEPVQFLDGTRDESRDASALPAMSVEQSHQPLYFSQDRHRHHQRPLLSTAATYGDINSARDTWSTSSRTVKAEDLSSIGSSRPSLGQVHGSLRSNPGLHRERLIPSIETSAFPIDRRLVEPRGESMIRSETLQSRRSRGEIVPRSDGEDFLSRIESQLDVEMAGSDSGEARSTHVSQPVSRTNSTRVSHRTSPDRANEADIMRVNSGSAITRRQQEPPLNVQRNDYLDRTTPPGEVSTQAMERQPSRVIEFDRQGNPVMSAGQVYQEASPPRRAVPRQRVDSFGRLVEPILPSYGRGYMAAQEIPAAHYMDDQYSRPSYVPYEYSSSQLYRPERIVDPVTGQTYIAERPPVRQLIEIGGPPRGYEELRQPLEYEYREVDPSTYGAEQLRCMTILDDDDIPSSQRNTDKDAKLMPPPPVPSKVVSAVADEVTVKGKDDCTPKFAVRPDAIQAQVEPVISRRQRAARKRKRKSSEGESESGSKEKPHFGRKENPNMVPLPFSRLRASAVSPERQDGLSAVAVPREVPIVTKDQIVIDLTQDESEPEVEHDDSLDDTAELDFISFADDDQSDHDRVGRPNSVKKKDLTGGKSTPVDEFDLMRFPEHESDRDDVESPTPILGLPLRPSVMIPPRLLRRRRSRRYELSEKKENSTVEEPNSVDESDLIHSTEDEGDQSGVENPNHTPSPFQRSTTDSPPRIPQHLRKPMFPGREFTEVTAMQTYLQGQLQTYHAREDRIGGKLNPVEL